jgi:hypothetical protein
MSLTKLGKKLALSLQALSLVFGFGLATAGAAMPALAGVASAASANCTATDPSNSSSPLQDGANCGQANGTSSNLFGNGGVFQTIANTLIFLVGAIAVLFLIIGGLRYVISNGDPKAVESAKNTILYAIVGIIIAILSFAAVQFVIKTFSNS